MNPTNEHREQARAIRLPFPCGCMDAHEGGGMAVEEYTCAAHRLIAEALSSRDAEVREVLEGLATLRYHGHEQPERCWCRSELNFSIRGAHDDLCLRVQALYTKLQPKENGSVR